MPTNSYLPINFTISLEAWAEIEAIREFYDKDRDDKASVLMISWGNTVLNDGKSWGHVVIGFYRTSERHEIRDGIQMLSGHEVVFSLHPIFMGNSTEKL
ncbi:hypothetical protein MKK65_00485 [Methylobacterium sp. J-001]|uniref:hypothetical protein n=1 Tax=Methylobacterium sp. J-001 TaxID=2836609 RepID=UPI001FBA25F6|nr:hypothetical protein [Methylobacterium sp. J-001]MCJ2115087.1 hypothetical protein [Methylobacterium sp. J-001]